MFAALLFWPKHEAKFEWQLYKIIDATNQNEDLTDYNFQNNINDRMSKVHITDNLRLRIGRNCIINRLSCIYNKID